MPDFEAIVIPHRSLSSRAVRRLAGAIAVACCVTAGAVAAAGAWPVIGFTGAEILLAALLLRLHLQSARARETLWLGDSGLRVVRIDGCGRRRECVLPAGWLSVRLQDRPGRVPALLLTARDVEEEIASSLGEAAKRDLAASLAAALDARRHPRFDNPQLRG
jgi:uncharacterized membrane protein